MRYVNCAASPQEQNLVAYMRRGNIYYRTSKAVGTEHWVVKEQAILRHSGHELFHLNKGNSERWPPSVSIPAILATRDANERLSASWSANRTPRKTCVSCPRKPLPGFQH
ncbi:hypothetical protein V5799_016899 [Amblyomma americanum]|uniref:SET domain-containing protein n=1 Tax=Amblyomma americanum TaxID=6943 RepID=A0AAQ4F3N0_AMBAM